MRVMLFGVDGLTFSILNPLMERGLLPNFQRLREGGAQGELQSTVPPMTPPAWMSISTGLSPAKHGIYDFWEYKKTEQGPRANIVTHRKGGKAIWNILSEWGKHVIIANVPMTYPPDPVNGLMLSGYMAPSMKANLTFPESFKDELLQTVPEYQIDLKPAVSSGQIGDLFAETLKMTRERVAMMRMLLSKNWDFFFVVFTGADRIQHLLWDKIMSFHPQAVEYYQMVDKALGMALDTLHPEDMLMVVSDHGFQGARRRFYIHEYLHSRGLLRIKSSSHLIEVRNLVRKLVHAAGLQRFTRQIRNKLRRLGILKIASEHHPIQMPDFDWVNTQAWIPSSSGSIAGYADIFFSDTMTEDQIDELMMALREVRDPKTGHPLVAEMYRESAFGSGPLGPTERHLILLSTENITLSNKLGTRTLWESDLTTGIHHPIGVLYLFGAGIKQGMILASTHVYDIVPTILSFMGLPLPDVLDGQVIEDAFEQPLIKRATNDSNVRRKLEKLAL